MTCFDRADRRVRGFGLFCLYLMMFAAVVGVSVSDRAADAAAVAGQEFAGTTPCDARSRQFLGGLPEDAGCTCITWRLTLLTNQTGRAGEYSLAVNYGLPGRTDPNQIEEGPKVNLKGTWEVDRGWKGDDRAEVFRLRGRDGKGSMSLARVGTNLLHFLEEDKSLRVGNAGWSYTLNRKGRL